MKNDNDPLIQLQSTRKAIEMYIEKFFNEMKGLKFVETLPITFQKQSAYFNCTAQTILTKRKLKIIKTTDIKTRLLNGYQRLPDG